MRINYSQLWNGKQHHRRRERLHQEGRRGRGTRRGTGPTRKLLVHESRRDADHYSLYSWRDWLSRDRWSYSHATASQRGDSERPRPHLCRHSSARGTTHGLSSSPVLTFSSSVSFHHLQFFPLSGLLLFNGVLALRPVHAWSIVQFNSRGFIGEHNVDRVSGCLEMLHPVEDVYHVVSTINCYMEAYIDGNGTNRQLLWQAVEFGWKFLGIWLADAAPFLSR